MPYCRLGENPSPKMSSPSDKYGDDVELGVYPMNLDKNSKDTIKIVGKDYNTLQVRKSTRTHLSSSVFCALASNACTSVLLRVRACSCLFV